MAGKRPRWADPSIIQSMRPIMVLPPLGNSTNLPPAALPCAVTSSEGRSFSLYRAGGAVETFDLPVYPESLGTFTRSALTPLTVTGDTVMVGGVAAGVGFLLWVQSGAPTH